MPLLAFGLPGVIWGSNFIYMKMAAGLIPPMPIVCARVLFGFVPVAIYARHAGHFLVMALLATAVYYYGFAKGTSLLLSGVAGTVNGAISLSSFALAVLFVAE